MPCAAWCFVMLSLHTWLRMHICGLSATVCSSAHHVSSGCLSRAPESPPETLPQTLSCCNTLKAQRIAIGLKRRSWRFTRSSCHTSRTPGDAGCCPPVTPDNRLTSDAFAHACMRARPPWFARVTEAQGTATLELVGSGLFVKLRMPAGIRASVNSNEEIAIAWPWQVLSPCSVASM